MRNLQPLWRRLSGEDLRVNENEASQRNPGAQIWAAELTLCFWEVVEEKKNEMSHVFLSSQHLSFLPQAKCLVGDGGPLC